MNWAAEGVALAPGRRVLSTHMQGAGRLVELVVNRLADARLVDIVEHIVAELRGICRLWHFKHQPHGSPLTAVYVRRRDPAPHQYENRVVSIASGISERERRSPHRYHLALAALIFDV